MEMFLTLSSGERDELNQRIHRHEKNKPAFWLISFRWGGFEGMVDALSTAEQTNRMLCGRR